MSPGFLFVGLFLFCKPFSIACLKFGGHAAEMAQLLEVLTA